MGCVRLWYHFLLGGLLCDAIIFLLWFNSNSPSRFHSSSLSFSRFFSLKHNEKNSYKNQVSAFFLSINRLGLRLLTLKWILTLFRYNKNNTGPNLDPCGTPHGEERREGGWGEIMFSLYQWKFCFFSANLEKGGSHNLLLPIFSESLHCEMLKLWKDIE